MTKQPHSQHAKSLLGSSKPKTLFWISIALLLISMSLLAATLWIQNGGLNAQPDAGYSIGTTVRFNRSEVVVNGVSYSKGSGMFTAPKGMHYVIVDMTVTNITSNPIQVMPSLDTYVKDQDGKMTYLSPSALPNTFRSGAVLKGESVRGQLSYLVTIATTQAFYTDATWSGGVAKFALN